MWSGAPSTRGPIAVTGQANLCASTADNIMSETGWLVLPGRYAPEVAMRPLLQRNDADEEWLCQRYLQDVPCSNRSNGPDIDTFSLPIKMRAAVAPVKTVATGGKLGGAGNTFLDFAPGSTQWMRYTMESTGDGTVYDEVWRIDARM